MNYITRNSLSMIRCNRRGRQTPEDLGHEVPTLQEKIGPNSSRQIQRKVGNTKQPSAKRHYLLTIKVDESWNSSNSSTLNSWLKQYCSAYAWQLECGTITGYTHIQLTMTLLQKQRLTWIKRHMCNNAHIEECNNIDASFDYSIKSETRIGRPHIYPSPVNMDSYIKDPLKNIELYSWQQWVLETIDTEPDPRLVYWFYDPIGNTGKSSLALHLILNYDAIVYDSNHKDILYAHTNASIVIFDIPRCSSTVSWHAIEDLKRGFGFSGKYESKMKLFRVPHVFIFSNHYPDTDTLSEDRWRIFNISQNGHFQLEKIEDSSLTDNMPN